MIVLVTGGRKFKKMKIVFDVLNTIHLDYGPIERIVNGGAAGVDQTSTYWSRIHGVRVDIYPAKWDEHGKKAGPIRNALMLKTSAPDIGVAFPGEHGTADMVRRMEAYQIRNPSFQLIKVNDIGIIQDRRGAEKT